MHVLHVLCNTRYWCIPQESLDSPIDRRSDYYRKRARQKRQASSSTPPAQRLLTAPNVLTFLRVLLVGPACLGQHCRALFTCSLTMHAPMPDGTLSTAAALTPLFHSDHHE